MLNLHLEKELKDFNLELNIELLNILAKLKILTLKLILLNLQIILVLLL